MTPDISSTLTLNDTNGVWSGEVLYLTHYPTYDDDCPQYGLQIGQAANSKDNDFGAATWFWIESEDGGNPIFCGETFNACQGDFNLDLVCSPPFDCIPQVSITCPDDFEVNGCV